jgi:thioesterase domain-containing protein
MGVPTLNTRTNDITRHGALPRIAADQRTIFFPGIMGGPSVFEWLAAHLLQDGSRGMIAMSYSTALVNSCTAWHELVLRYTEIARQLLAGDSAKHVRLVAYSFGCRIAYAVGGLLEVEGHKVELVLLDGPIGGPRGSIEQALLGLMTQAEAAQSAGEAAIANRLVSLLTNGGELPPEPLGRRANVSLFVTSNDNVGVDVVNEYLPSVPIRRVNSSHRELLSPRRAAELAQHIRHTRAAEADHR